ncbi:hypothetical protein [Pelagibius sp. Alg239-R121]|uniref:hypothetical protein n=1 Tax=Pelagibius sp. Alg239-R121 TaxID=2993448 RepID=UPI0024A78EED|nr:hypothetical protein [Pelagibius sp. Alg239-R121]
MSEKMKLLRRIKLAFTLLVGLTVLAGYFWPREVTAGDFAAELLGIVTEGRIGEFRALPCVPSDCIHEETVQRIFGQTGETESVKTFLTRPGIKAKTYGPFQFDERGSEGNFIVVYYAPRW